MPKRKSNQTNSSPSQEIVTPQKPALVRVVKQETTDTPAPSESSSTPVLKENPNSIPELHVNNNQSQSKEEESSNSTSVSTPDPLSPQTNAAIDSSDLTLTAEMATVNVEELTQNSSSEAIELAQPERENKQSQLEKRIPPYKKLETVTNCKGQTFTVGDEIQVSTSNFGSQQAVITFLYSVPDGSIWASYYPLIKDQWRRGCCRIEHLNKLSENINNS
jgi:hypothetical protein